MVAARAAISPTMSPDAAEADAVPAGRSSPCSRCSSWPPWSSTTSVQTMLRIAQQMLHHQAFYGHDESLGRQAQRAGAGGARRGREIRRAAKGMFGQAKTRRIRGLQGRRLLEERQSAAQGRCERCEERPEGDNRQEAAGEDVGEADGRARGGPSVGAEQARDTTEESSDTNDRSEGPTGTEKCPAAIQVESSEIERRVSRRHHRRRRTAPSNPFTKRAHTHGVGRDHRKDPRRGA